MTVPAGLNRKLSVPESLDEGLVLVPFGFTINGTSDPDGLIGDMLDTVTRSEQGEFLCTLTNRPAVCFYGHAEISSTADDVDIYGKVDWSTVVSAGTFVVRCMTATTETDPTDNLKVGGFLLVKKTDRSKTGT